MKHKNLTSAQNIITKVAERLKIARHRRHLTLAALSKNLNISCKQLQNYEKAKCNLTIVRLCEISQILDVDPTFFIKGLGAKKNFISNSDLLLINKLHRLKNKQIKQNFINLLNDL